MDLFWNVYQYNGISICKKYRNTIPYVTYTMYIPTSNEKLVRTYKY